MCKTGSCRRNGIIYVVSKYVFHRKIGGVIMTLKEFWNNANGVYDFINKNGETIDDMVYPLERIISW